MAPPSGEARAIPGSRVALMHKTSCDTARTAVQILVAAPDREIRPPVMEVQRQVSGRMREVEGDDTSLPAALPW